MLAKLYVVVDSDQDEVVEDITNQLLNIRSNLSFSPFCEAPQLKHCMHAFATTEIEEEEIRPFIDQLNNDWTESDDYEYDSYGFNTKMFDKRVYYLFFQVFK